MHLRKEYVIELRSKTTKDTKKDDAFFASVARMSLCLVKSIPETSVRTSCRCKISDVLGCTKSEPTCSSVVLRRRTNKKRENKLDTDAIPFAHFHHQRDTTMKFVAALFLFVNSATAFSLSSPASFTKTSSSTQLMGEFGASSTSFYTTTEKKDSYESLEDVLSNKCSDPKVRHVIKDMLNVCAEITEALRTALVTVEGSMNDFGDAQLSVDVSTAGKVSFTRSL